jgi:glutathione-regulated potassium-efflux system ancillary protein KefF
MDHSRATRALMRCAARLPASQVTVRDLYALYPDYLIDTGAEQQCPGGRALQGKALWLAASTGGPEASYRPDGYNRCFFDAFLHPCEQTAALTGMRWLPPLVLHGAHRATDKEIDAHAALFSARLAAWPSVQGWPELADDAPALPACEVPADARPAVGGG